MLKIEQLKVGIAFPAFIGSFRQVFPKIEVVKGNPYNYNLIIFSGGEDISPSIYNNKETYSTGVNVERDRIELEILNTIYGAVRNKDISKTNLYLLGVCRGHQLINAVNRGSLVQDIYIELQERHGGNHTLELGNKFYNKREPSEMILNFYHEGKKAFIVNSMHHQGVVYCGENLKPTSFLGSVIESTENERIVTTQWHPEFMDSEKFFSWLVTKILNGQNLFVQEKGVEEKGKASLRFKKIDSSRFASIAWEDTNNIPYTRRDISSDDFRSISYVTDAETNQPAEPEEFPEENN